MDFTFQDNSGFIWFGTSEGLTRFDGIEYQNFTTADSLYTNEISALFQDSSGVFWIGHTSGEITTGTPGKFRKWMPEEGLPKQKITTFFIDNESNIWFGTAGEGVYYYNHKRVYNINKEDGLSDNYIYKISQDDKNRIWIATDYGLNIYDQKENSFIQISMKYGLPDNIVKDFCFIDSSRVLIGMEDEGLVILNLTDTSFTPLLTEQFGSLNNFIVRNNEIWVSTKKAGIIFLSKDNDSYNVRQFTNNEGLLTNRTNHIFIDREENIWITSRKGVVQSPSSILSFLDKSDGLNVSNIYNYIIDAKNTSWIATENGVFLMNRDGSINNTTNEFVINNALSGKAFISIYQDTKGYIWLGTYGYGVFRISPDRLKVENFTTENGLGNNNIISITGKDELVVFSTLGGGISTYQYNLAKRFKTKNVSSGLPSNYVYSSFIDSKNRIWLAMDGGLAFIENDKVISISKLADLNITKFYGITQDRKQNIWISTASQGIIRYNNDTIKIFNTNIGLHSNAYLSILYDGVDKIVLVSQSGIDLLNINDETLSFYGNDFGLNNFEPTLNAIFQDNNSNIWITGKKSILKYNTTRSYNQKTKPQILLTNKKVYFDTIPEGKTVFKFKQNHFTFDFISLWYSAPERVLYRYKLINYDLDWSTPNNIKSVTYSNLIPGEYTFKLQATNETGEWYETENTSFSFKIRPPFWQTWWFISIGIISLIGFVYFIIIYRTRSLEKAKDELEEEVKNRTAKIQLQKEEIEAQRDEIEKKNKDTIDSILYASRIQTAVIPPLNDLTNVFKDVFVLNKPRDIVSGDFYWFSRRENLIFLAAADCTGHGVPGAFMSMLGIASLNEIVNSNDCQRDASFILTSLRDKIKASLRQEGKIGEAKDGMDMAFCVIDMENMKLSYAGAYNPLWLIRSGELIPYPADKMPIGVHLGAKSEFKNNMIDLKADDRFYIFSDGYIDQFGGENGRKFLKKNFKTLLLDIHTHSFSEQKEILDVTLEKWKGQKYHQIDDILVIGFKI
ncbi:MAG: two-component regulator propeller domain-containing protein [Tenuifilaceae bacterium]|nr:two-component regulator propeller domain-containing protein [Tenuifilaceae bacterium]